MKRRLLDWVVCPRCGSRPRLEVFLEEVVSLPEPIAAPACSSYCARHDCERPVDIEPPPDCTDCFRHEVAEGLLSCSCGATYPIVGGIPRLIPEAEREYADFYARRGLRRAGKAAAVADRRSRKSFKMQWTIYKDGDRTWFKDDANLRKREFLDIFRCSAADLFGRSLLDGGCGNGELTRAVAEYGPEVVAMDFSKSVEGARRRLLERGFAVSHRVHYVQGDVLAPPLAPESFDFVHSSGVLHHTPSTYRAFRSIARLTRPGGKLYVQLYRLRERWVHVTNVTLRAVTTRMPMPLLYGLCYAATPVHAALSRLVHRLRREPPPPRSTARERAVQMFDNYSPRFQYRHTVPEIEALFASEGYEDVKDVTLPNEARHMLALLGTKPLAARSAQPGTRSPSRAAASASR